MAKLWLFVSFASLALLSGSRSGNAITQHKAKSFPYIFDPLALKSSISFPVIEVVEKIRVPTKVLKLRIRKSTSDERIEPVQIKVPAEQKEISILARKLAKRHKVTKLFEYLSQAFYDTKTKIRKDGTKRVTIKKQALKHIQTDKLAKLFEANHHKVLIDVGSIKAPVKRQLLNQTRGFLTRIEQQKLKEKLSKARKLNLEKDLLPSFAKRMVRKYLAFRGPNCFHASLAFHGQDLTQSPFFNIKQEQGYHRSMINYDELWRAINSSFYEVDPNHSPLKYGDMLVFFDLPKESQHRTYFRWIRHAATYLFGPYTFSKGSKSPDTPYTIKTLKEEWETWRKYSKNLAVKVYRRTRPQNNTMPPLDLTDWIY